MLIPQRREDHARAQGVDPDALAGELHRQRLRQPDDAELAGAVGGIVAVALPCPTATTCSGSTPCRRGSIRRMAAWQPTKAPVRLTRWVSSQVARVHSRNGTMNEMPALLTQMAMGPSRASISSGRAFHAGRVGDVERPGLRRAVPPRESLPPRFRGGPVRGRSLPRPRLRRRTSGRCAAPMPLPPPVTTATFPASLMSLSTPQSMRRPPLTAMISPVM